MPNYVDKITNASDTETAEIRDKALTALETAANAGKLVGISGNQTLTAVDDVWSQSSENFDLTTGYGVISRLNDDGTPWIKVAQVNGIVKSDNNGALSAAVVGTDYVVPSGNITGTAGGLSETLGVSKGGTGSTTLTANAILAGNGTSAVKKIATASGALYATAANGASQFGTLPVAQGGTGNTTADAAASALLSNMNTTSATGAVTDDMLIATSAVSGETNTWYRRKISYVWTYIKGKADAIYAALSHTHAAGDITSGTLAVGRGGTGNTSVDTAPTSSSTKMVTSGGLYTTFSNKLGRTSNITAEGAVGTKMVRAIYAGTSDMTAGSTALTTGTIYLVYEE